MNLSNRQEEKLLRSSSYQAKIADALADAVRKIYDIREDDTCLRQIAEKPEDKRGKYFDGLRKKYHIRREFQNTKVFVEDKNSALTKKLKGIGFKTSEK